MDNIHWIWTWSWAWMWKCTWSWPMDMEGHGFNHGCLCTYYSKKADWVCGANHDNANSESFWVFFWAVVNSFFCNLIFFLSSIIFQQTISPTSLKSLQSLPAHTHIFPETPFHPVSHQNTLKDCYNFDLIVTPKHISYLELITVYGVAREHSRPYHCLDTAILYHT